MTNEEVKKMQTIKITITSPTPANIHIKEDKTKEVDLKEKLGEALKKLSLKDENNKDMEG
jgi:hypothetical protein